MIDYQSAAIHVIGHIYVIPRQDIELSTSHSYGNKWNTLVNIVTSLIVTVPTATKLDINYNIYAEIMNSMKLVIPLHFISWKRTPNDAVTPQRQSQFTPKMKANAVSRLLSSLV